MLRKTEQDQNRNFVFVEDADKKKDLSLLSAANALKRKSEEMKQGMRKLEETLVSWKKK